LREFIAPFRGGLVVGGARCGCKETGVKRA